MFADIIVGDALTKLKTLEPESVDCVVTSPPYWNQRNYKVAGQLGLEVDFEDYLDKLFFIFIEIKRVLKESGSVWVNIGDTYNGAKTPDGISNKSLIGIPDRFKVGMIDMGWICRNEIIWYKRSCMPNSAKDRFTVDFERLFFFAKSPDYYFETQYEPYSQYTITTGDYRVPSSDIRQEYDSKYTLENYKQNIRPDSANLKNRQEFKQGKMVERNGFKARKGNVEYEVPKLGRIKRCVWDITNAGFKGQHFAVFPEKLVLTPILAGCPEFVCSKCGKNREKSFKTEIPMDTAPVRSKGNFDDTHAMFTLHEKRNYLRELGIKGDAVPHVLDGISDCGCGAEFKPGVVLDPFCGSGTTGVVALKNNRNFIGIDLNVDYALIAKDRIQKSTGVEARIIG